MADVAYAVYTTTCTYLLDEEGVCRWVMAPSGTVPPEADRCVGAQFVGCLDLRVVGGLVGELLVGAHMLFARYDDDAGRLILLRTTSIDNVEFRKPVETRGEAPLPRFAFATAGAAHASALHPAGRGGAEELGDEDLEVIDPEELHTYGGGVSLTAPLFRAESQYAAQAGRAGAPRDDDDA
jgi:hypothetical protein